MQAVRAGKGETGSRNEKKAKERLFTALSIMAIQLRGAAAPATGVSGAAHPPHRCRASQGKQLRMGSTRWARGKGTGRLPTEWGVPARDSMPGPGDHNLSGSEMVN